MKARQISSTWTRGRHWLPSVWRSTSCVATAYPTRLFTTMSLRSRGENPYAVALRRKVGEKVSSARRRISRSAQIFDSPYGVTGLNAAPSSIHPSPAEAPYRLHDDENRKRGTPAFLASCANRTLAA